MHQPPSKSFNELVHAWDEAVAEAATKLPDVDSYPYSTIMIPIDPFQLDPMSIYRNCEATPNHINSEDAYVTFRKKIIEGVVVGWEKG